MSALGVFSRQLAAIAAEPRPIVIHRHPCAHCPSVQSSDDPESVDIRDRGSLAEKVESAFPCAWRREKLCKGYCDFVGVTQEDLCR